MHSDRRCGEGLASWKEPVTIQCPTNNSIVRVVFASFGNPSGACGKYVEGSCHYAQTARAVGNLCRGKQWCSLSPNNVAFKNTCPELFDRRLYVQVSCRGDITLL